MKVQSVSLSKGITVPLENKFQSHRVEFGMTVDVEPGEDYDEVVDQVSKIVNANLFAQLGQLADVPAKGKQVLMEQEAA